MFFHHIHIHNLVWIFRKINVEIFSNHLIGSSSNWKRTNFHFAHHRYLKERFVSVIFYQINAPKQYVGLGSVTNFRTCKNVSYDCINRVASVCTESLYMSCPPRIKGVDVKFCQCGKRNDRGTSSFGTRSRSFVNISRHWAVHGTLHGGTRPNHVHVNPGTFYLKFLKTGEKKLPNTCVTFLKICFLFSLLDWISTNYMTVNLILF